MTIKQFIVSLCNVINQQQQYFIRIIGIFNFLLLELLLLGLSIILSYKDLMFSVPFSYI